LDYAPLHTAISNAQRIDLIRDIPLAQVLTAPGHRTLRHPEAVEAIANEIRAGRTQRILAEPILIGLFTSADGAKVQLRAVECIDGHHRLLAGMRAGAWRTIGDIPLAALDTRVNGWRADGAAPEPRWIPLQVAKRSALPRADWSVVPPQWGAKGPTAMISGALSGGDAIFAPADRSITFAELLAQL